MIQSTRIKTNIKFYKGLNNAVDRVYGFITKINGSWRGCREKDCNKKIVFVDTDIAKDILPNVLYSCSLVPMGNNGGFIAKTATIVKFEGIIRTTCRKDVFIVSVQFGNKLYIYDPASKEQRKRDIKRIADTLRNRVDLVDAINVAEEFINAAFMVRHMYNQTHEDVH